MATLNTPLAEPAPQGALQASSLISSAGLNETLEACRGCTFFIPIDDAFKGAEDWLGSLNETSIEALLRNHVSLLLTPLPSTFSLDGKLMDV